ncbi:putative Kelch domain-containing protein, partial [Naja naja]
NLEELNSRVFLSGNKADCFSNDIHKLDSSNMMWSLICTKLATMENYIYWCGYNARLNRHFHDLWKFDPVCPFDLSINTLQYLYFTVYMFSPVSFTWKKIEPKGKGPCPRRRQCCCRVGDKIILFGGTR